MNKGNSGSTGGPCSGLNLMAILHHPVYGGPQNRMLRLAPEFARRGVSLVVVLPNETGNAADRLRDAGVDVIVMPLSRFRATSFPWSQLGTLYALATRDVPAISRLLAEREIDVVLLAGLVNPHGAIAARIKGLPVLWQIVDSRLPASAVRVCMLWVRYLSDCVMFWGRPVEELHVGRRPLRRPSLRSHSAVDLDRFRPSLDLRDSVRNEFDIPQDVLLVGLVANLNPQKGVEYFIRAAQIIHRELPRTWFINIGAAHDTHPEYRELLEEERRRADIPVEQLLFIGGRADLERFYPALDVQVITSVPRSEGIPSVALEGMACGVPIVATRAGSTEDVVKDSETGYVVPTCDPSAIAVAVLRLLNDPNERERFSHEALKVATNNFGVDVVAGVHMQAIHQAISHRADRRTIRGLSALLTAHRRNRGKNKL